ncbi:hypothetical protein EXS71_00075 [Candidatus Uhrbacteria bacterium]|nr:hypothetical protein [Candidatus Uhrbacteria bacterium]
MSERPPALPPKGQPIPEREWRSLEVIIAILEGNDRARRLELKTRLRISDREFKLATYYTRQRKGVLAERQRLTEERMVRHPDPTAAERAMGYYAEQIESQVSEAVLTLRKKGYPTHGSGYGDIIKPSQFIYFNPEKIPLLTHFHFPDALKPYFEKMGVEPFAESERVGFRCGKALSVEELKDVWSKIAEALPVIGPESLTPSETSVMPMNKHLQVGPFKPKRQI